MRRRSLAVGIVTVAAGIVGFFLRRRFVADGFDESTGFPVPSAVKWLLVGLTLSTVVFLFAATLGKKLKTEKRGSATGKPLLPFFCVLVSSALIAAGSLLLPRHSISRVQIFPKIETALAVMGVIAAVSQAAAALGRLLGRKGRGLCHLDFVPPIFAAFALVVCYLLYASDPVVLHFAWEILALAAAAYGLYAAAAPESSVSRWSLVRWTGLGVFFLMTALGSLHGLGVTLGLMGLLLRLAAEFFTALFQRAGQLEDEN